MSDETLIKLQIQRENNCKQKAERELQKNLQKHYDNANAGGSIWGISLRNDLIGQMVETLEEELERLPTQVGNQVAERYQAVQQCTGVKFKRTKGDKTGELINLFDAEVACHIALMLCLDAACAPKISKGGSSTDHWKLHRPTRIELELRIARELQRQLRWKLAERNYPGWMKDAKKKALGEFGRSSPHYVHNRLELAINDLISFLKWKGDDLAAQGLQIEQWSYQQEIHVGSWLVQKAYSTGIFEWEKATNKNGKPDLFIALSAVGKPLRDAYIQSALSYAFHPIPMLIPPQDLTKDRLGGWIADGICTNANINGGYKGDIELSQQHLDFYNHQQRQPFRVNRFVLSLVQELKARNEQVGAWKWYDKDRDHTNLPVYRRLGISSAVWDTATKQQQDAMLQADDKAFKAAKRARAEAFAAQDQKLEQSRLSRLLLDIAEECADDERFFIPIQPDFRSRYNCRVAFLSYQSGDAGRSLLEFADPHPIDSRTKHHLAIHLANCAGEDKKSFDDRLYWVESNKAKISAIAGILSDWEAGWQALKEFDGEDPLQLAAACKEYFDLFISKTRTVTHLPCSVDATCSGQQLIAAQLRSRELAELVNVVPTTKPGDVYREVMNRMIQLSHHSTLGNFSKKTLELLQGKVGRKLSKAGFMGGQYGAGLKKQLEQMHEKVLKPLEEQEGIKLRPEEWALFVGARVSSKGKWELVVNERNSVWHKAIEEVTKIRATFNWFSHVAELVHAKGAKGLKLPLPTGSVIHQRYSKRKTTKIETFHFGSSTYKRSQRNAQQITNEPTLKDWKKATAPNQIHGLDASVLCIALGSFQSAFFACHDSVSTYAGKPMDDLLTALRAAFVDVARFDMWSAVLEANGLDKDNTMPPPIVGTLDIDLTLKSNYLFC